MRTMDASTAEEIVREVLALPHNYLHFPNRIDQACKDRGWQIGSLPMLPSFEKPKDVETYLRLNCTPT